MKVGDLVQIKQDIPKESPLTCTVWHEFMGKVGVIIAPAARVNVPAFKVFLQEVIAEFDLDELIRIGENDG